MLVTPPSHLSSDTCLEHPCCFVGYAIIIVVCLRKGHVFFLSAGFDLSISLGPEPHGASQVSELASCSPVHGSLSPPPPDSGFLWRPEEGLVSLKYTANNLRKAFPITNPEGWTFLSLPRGFHSHLRLSVFPNRTYFLTNRNSAVLGLLPNPPPHLYHFSRFTSDLSSSTLRTRPSSSIPWP